MAAPLALLVEKQESLRGRPVYTNTSHGMGWDGIVVSTSPAVPAGSPRARFCPAQLLQLSEGLWWLEISCPARYFHSSGNIVLI